MANNEVRDTLQALFGDVAPKLADVTQKVVFDDIWQRPELSKRDRSVVTVAALIAMNRAEQLPAHLKRALDNGVTRTELEEIVTHLAFYAGFPCAITAARLTHELYKSLDG